MTTVRDLVAEHPQSWAEATHHPFLDGARDGILPVDAFDRWLVQDRLFLDGLVRSWAAVLAAAPAGDIALLAGGISAFVAEMAWLERVAETRRLAVDDPPLAATSAYREHLRDIAGQPYPVAMAALWAVEAAYLEAWQAARPGAPAYREFVEHWTDDGFAAFVADVEAAADRALARATTDEVDAARAALLATAKHEAAFWAMTWSG